MQTRRFFRRLKLRTVLLLALLLSGIIPLAISSALLIDSNRDVLSNAERDNLILKAGALSREVNAHLVTVRRQITQFGRGLLIAPGGAASSSAFEEAWVRDSIQQFLRDNPDLVALRVLDSYGTGLAPGNLSPQAAAAMDEAFDAARDGKTPAAYRFVKGGTIGKPLVALAVPVSAGKDGPLLIVEALFTFQPLQEVSQQQAEGVGVYLVDREGKLLWSDGGDPAMEKGLLESEMLRSFVSVPLSQTQEYRVPTGNGERDVLAQVSAINETGWGLVVQKPRAEAFSSVTKMIYNAALSTALLVALALFFAYMAARWVSLPIQRLADTTHEIAEGNFGERVEMRGLTFELADLAEDFNRMSGYMESYVQQLKQAAQANRDLFIGSLRAFVAAVDAKDPYTRGHSERVAAYSRTIARYLQLPEEVQHKIWIGALLHDVGKIGVEDRILRKEGVLAPDEYEQMKLHTVMGADIMTPIEQLKEMIPAIRWHHEAWNGRGYPDGLKGEQIPLFGRIVAVADTFDAITTNRPYQQAYSLQFAVETITRLTGSRFDAKIVTAFLRAFEAGEIRVGPARPARPEGQEQQELRAASPR
jgi:putative nucleotidyltransferase with HDIG domain